MLLTVRLCRDAGAAVIFRYYPELVCRQTGLTSRQVHEALDELEATNWVYRDGVVLWVRNGLRHDPNVRLSSKKHQKTVVRQLQGLPASHLITKFCHYYEIDMAINGLSDSGPPNTEYRVPKKTDNRIPSAEPQDGPSGLAADAASAPAPPKPWQLAERIRVALSRTRFADLAQHQSFWQAQFKAHNGVDFAGELLKAEAWCASNPNRSPRKNTRRFLHGWFSRAHAPEA